MRLTNVATTSKPRLLPALLFTCLVLLGILTLAVSMGLNPPGDELLVSWAISTRSDALTALLQVLTFLGSAVPTLVVCILLSGIEWINLRRDRVHTPTARPGDSRRLLRSAWPLIAFTGMLVCNIVMRTLINRLSPQVEAIPNLLPEIQTVFQRFSFPSGHASTAMVAYGALALMAWRIRAIRWKVLIVSFAVILIFGVGFGRVYLGVHWPSDVIAGYLLGLIWLLIALPLSWDYDPETEP
jgi:undecaprenyl-diphosphatase